MVKLFLLCSVLAFMVFPQTKISGVVTNSKKEPLPSANVFIKNSYDGASTGMDGNFSFTTTEAGEVTLVASYIGYKPWEQKITLNKKPVTITIILQENSALMKTVVISAGSFEASDENKAVILKPLDILLTAGASGDVYGALNTLPGTQQVGDKEGLFVRGGSAAETKTIIDEMVVQNPFYSSIPDVQQRGRFSPSLFKGTMFSSGGYSAQYGQALSSTLILKSQDIAPATTSSLSLMMLGFGGMHTEHWEDRSLTVAADYYNLAPYKKLFPGRYEYDEAPVTKDASVIYREKFSTNGMLKFYSTYSGSDLSIYLHNINLPDNKDLFRLQNKNFYLNASYRDIFSKEYTFFAGASYSTNIDNIVFQNNVIKTTDNLAQAKVTLSKELWSGGFLNSGAEIESPFYEEGYNGASYHLSKPFTAAFTELETPVLPSIAARFGLRYENSTIIDKTNLAPRFAMAWQLSDHGQINLAYGRFFENPERQFLFQTRSLSFEQATHYIINYQHLTDETTFRIEAYYKDYSNLVKTNAPITNNVYYPLIGTYFNNAGKGYAKGIDIFWRDETSLKSFDYWISYSYLDTKRDYHNFPGMATPVFAVPHTASFVGKYFMQSIMTAFSGTFTYASGRPYYNPNNADFLSDRTKAYEKLALSVSYLTNVFGNFTVIYASLDNVLGRNNVFGYQYSDDGARREEIGAAMGRTFFLGMFINFERKNTDN